MAQSYKTFGPAEDFEEVAVELNVPPVALVDDHGNPVFDKNGNLLHDRAEGESLKIGMEGGYDFPFQARTGAEEAALDAHPYLKRVSHKEAKSGGEQSRQAAPDNGGEK